MNEFSKTPEDAETWSPVVERQNHPETNTSIEREIHERVNPVIKRLSEVVTDKGLVPEIGERGKEEGYNSEMLGYALRLAANAGDRSLFFRLKQGVEHMRLNNGLLRARETKEGIPDLSKGSTWADGNQDIALALIEAGEKWGDLSLLQAGKSIARAFVENQVVDVDGNKIVLCNTKVENETILGTRIYRLNLSMYNFRLYEAMRRLSPEENCWQELIESGLNLTKASLEKFKLPPNYMNVVDGQLASDQEVAVALSSGAELAETVPQKTIEMVKAVPPEELRPVWAFDAIRIPYRLTDFSDPRGLELAKEIHDRLLELGGIKTIYYADNGELHAKGELSAVAVAPLVKTLAEKSGNKEEAMRQIDKSICSADNRVLYWQLWRALGLTQLTSEITSNPALLQ